MSNFLYTTDKDTIEKVDIDSLFEKKQQKDMKQLNILNNLRLKIIF